MANMTETIIKAINAAMNEQGEFSVEDVCYFYQKHNGSHVAKEQVVNTIFRLSADGERIQKLSSKGWYQWKTSRVSRTPAMTSCVRKAFEALGLTAEATSEDVKQAFRNLVKSSADGQGGYKGDMDNLVCAKEKALAYVGGC